MRFIPFIGGLCLLLGCGHGFDRMDPFPDRVLWAWESPQDLRFLSHGEGVALLAGELTLAGSEAHWVPRRNPLKVNPGTPLMAVMRVETRTATLDADQREAFVFRCLEIAKLPGVTALQIDFDAMESQRGFYLAGLRNLRGRLPENIRLSITALASWCLEDRWMQACGLARVVDEAVPMLFRMGSERARVCKTLAQSDFEEHLAQGSYGLSTDEPLPRLRRGRRCYVFHPGPWKPEDWERIRRELK
jgi:Protein of unknown function (DUF3142)